jgi:hypothetical protein
MSGFSSKLFADVPLTRDPIATQNCTETQETLTREEDEMTEVLEGAAMVDQALPSHRASSGPVVVGEEIAAPTATQNVGEAHDTPINAPLRAELLLLIVDH